jgi:hypothetical protein
MSKHHKKGEGVKLVGSPVELINLLLKNQNDRKETMDQLTEHGPKHKQVVAALLLKRLYKLATSVQKISGRSYVPQKGFELTLAEENETFTVPTPLPVQVSSNYSKEKIVKAISHAPVHEALIFTLCLQVVEWSIVALAKPVTPSEEQKRSPLSDPKDSKIILKTPND